MGSGCEVKKGDNAEKLESCNRTPVQPVSAMRGEAKARDNAEDCGSESFGGGDRVTGAGGEKWWDLVVGGEQTDWGKVWGEWDQ